MLHFEEKSESNADDDDALFEVMRSAYTKDASAQFIRSTKTAPDPAIVLANDFQ